MAARRSIWARRLGAFIVPVALIGVGVAVGSPAMEWAGLALTFLLLLATTIHNAKAEFTIDEARDKLNELERQ